MDLTQRLLERIAKVDATLKSYATITADQAIAAARVAEEEIRAGKYRGPLHGVPVAVKDLCYTKGVRTMGGTPVRKDFVPAFDGTVVSKLRRAGAVVLGKLNLSEGATAGYNPVLDVPLNPWNPDRWPGMSSSGSGVAVAAGLVLRRHRHRHRWIDSQPLVCQRRGWSQADVRPRESIRRAGDGRLARSRRPDGAPRR